MVNCLAIFSSLNSIGIHRYYTGLPNTHNIDSRVFLTNDVNFSSSVTDLRSYRSSLKSTLCG